MSYPISRSHIPVRIQEASASAAERGLADRKFQPEPARPQPLLVEAGPASRAAAALQSGVDALGGVWYPSRPENPKQSPREIRLRAMTQAQRIAPWVQCMRAQQSRQVDASAAEVYEYCPGDELASDVIRLTSEIKGQELRDDVDVTDRMAVEQVLLFARAVFRDALTQMFRITPDETKILFMMQMLHLMEFMTPTAEVQSNFRDIFSLLGASEGRPNLEARPAYARKVRKILFDSPCFGKALPLRKIAVESYYKAWLVLYGSDPLGILADPFPRIESFDLRRDLLLTRVVKIDMDLMDRLWRDYPVPRNEANRLSILYLRSTVYWNRPLSSVGNASFRARLEDRLLNLLVKPFGQFPVEAVTPQMHDRNFSKFMGLSSHVRGFWQRNLQRRCAQAVRGMLHVPLPPLSQADLRAQTLELRAYLIADLMESDWTRPMVEYMASPLPVSDTERTDALALRGAVWGTLERFLNPARKHELIASRGAYDLTFAALPNADRRLLRDNLCSNLYKHNPRLLYDALVKELAQLGESAAGAERRSDYWADVIHIDGLGKILTAQELAWMIDQALIQNAAIADVETRADQIVDLARATRAGLTPKNFERLRDALLKIDGLRPASVADSKAARATASQLSLDERLNGAGSPAVALRRAMKILDLYAQVYAGGDDPVPPELSTAEFFESQFAFFYYAQRYRFTEAEDDLIARNLEGLRASYATLE